MKERPVTSRQVFWLVIVVLILHDILLAGIYLTLRKEGTAAGRGGAEAPVSLLENLDPAPDFALISLDGHALTADALRGRVVLVDFWGTWCKSCCDEMPGLGRVYRRFKDRGFVLIGVAVEFDLDVKTQLRNVRRKVEELGLSFPIVLGDDGVVQLFGGKLENFPQTYLIDREGGLRKRIVGARSEEYWEELVGEAMVHARAANDSPTNPLNSSTSFANAA